MSQHKHSGGLIELFGTPDPEKDTAIAQAMGDVIADFVSGYWPTIDAYLTSGEDSYRKRAEVILSHVLGALQWPELNLMPDSETLNDTKARVRKLVATAHKNPAHNFGPSDPKTGLGVVVGHQARSIATALEGGQPVGDQARRTLASANVVVELGAASLWFRLTKNQLTSLVIKSDATAKPKKAKAPSP